ncbi:MAG: hypothetical protein MK105_04830 [Crocinitomicaceae bacterium]|nr:hypothetical protein [Crocinitomicaceae bacterium]
MWALWITIVAGFLTAGFTLFSIWKLFLKDRQKTEQITKLSSIAESMKDQLDLNEKRYKNLIRPNITATAYLTQPAPPAELLSIKFINTNTSSTIETVEFPQIPHGVNSLMKVALSTNNEVQTFGVQLRGNKIPSGIVLSVDYITEDGYKYIQDVVIINNGNGDVEVVPSKLKEVIEEH